MAGGAAALNQVWERQTDRLMRRTQTRPMADMRMTVAQGTTFGLVLTIIGAAELAFFINPLSAIVALLTTASYVLFYTPLKLRTSLSTIAGALPGALPAFDGSDSTSPIGIPKKTIVAALYDSGLSLLHPHAANWFMDGNAPRRTGNAHPNIYPYDALATGTVPIFVAVGNDRTAGGRDATDDYPCGMTRVTFTATDDAGNLASCESLVVVEPPSPPAAPSSISRRVSPVTAITASRKASRPAIASAASSA